MGYAIVSKALSDYNRRSTTIRNTASIAIYEAGMLSGRGIVHTLSCRDGFRVTAAFTRLPGSPFASV